MDHQPGCQTYDRVVSTSVHPRLVSAKLSDVIFCCAEPFSARTDVRVPFAVFSHRGPSTDIPDVVRSRASKSLVYARRFEVALTANKRPGREELPEGHMYGDGSMFRTKRIYASDGNERSKSPPMNGTRPSQRVFSRLSTSRAT